MIEVKTDWEPETVKLFHETWNNAVENAGLYNRLVGTMVDPDGVRVKAFVHPTTRPTVGDGENDFIVREDETLFLGYLEGEHIYESRSVDATSMYEEKADMDLLKEVLPTFVYEPELVFSSGQLRFVIDSEAVM